MRTFIIAASLAAVAAAAVPALALQHGEHAGGAERHDGPISRGDVQAKVRQRFAMVDANHDGAVTRAEFDTYGTAMQAERAARRGAARDEMFDRLDTNRDGQISKAEFGTRSDRGPEGRSRGDGADGHGGMHHGGSMGGWGGFAGPNGDRRADGFFAAMDADKDGKVTLAEAMAKPLAMFDKADANHDGTVTPEEHRAARGAMRADWKARRG